MTPKPPEHSDSLSLAYISRRLRLDYDAATARASEESRNSLRIASPPTRFTSQSTQVTPIDEACRDRNAGLWSPEMTIAEFVKSVFVPEHVAKKKRSGQTHYQAILKHVLTPEEVNCIFHVTITPSTKLKALPDWPYLSNLRLCDTGSQDVQRLISAALMRGYSTQTVTHIRNVVNAIFSCAKRELLFVGDNPASVAKLPEMIRKEPHALTLAQLQNVFAVMQYPERELALMAIFTGMNVTEICGLQWKFVNLTDGWSYAGDEPIPPKTIMVRKRWYCSQLSRVNGKSRERRAQIPASLLPVLIELSHRVSYNRPNDFVLVSRSGGPISSKSIAVNRLKAIGKELGMPWLSWQVFHRTRAALRNELEKQFQDHITIRDFKSTIQGPLMLTAQAVVL